MTSSQPDELGQRAGPWSRRDLAPVGLVIVAIALWTGADATLTDPFWMAREGADVLATGDWSHADRWGAVPAAHPFIPTSPLWQVLLASGWSTAGSLGLLVVSATGIALTLAAVAAASRRLGAAPLAVTLVLAVLATVPAALTMRPTTAAIGLFLATLATADRLLQAGDGRLAWLLPLHLATSALGIWLHASWVVYGPLCGAAVGFIALRRAPRSRALLLAGLCTLAATAGTWLGPRGLRAWDDARRIQQEVAGIITEWLAPWDHPTTRIWLAIWLSLITVALWLLGSTVRRHARANDLQLALLGSAAALLLGAAMALRLIPQAAIVLAPVLAAVLTQTAATTRWRRWQAHLGQRGSAGYWGTLSGLVAASLLPVVLLATTPPYPQLRDPAFAQLPTGCRLLTDAATANLVLLARTDVRPWVDGRADMWGRQHLLTAQALLTRGAPPSTVDCILQRRDRPTDLRERLAVDPSWAERTVDSSAFILWVRR